MKEFFKKHLWLYRIYCISVVFPVVSAIFVVEVTINGLWNAGREFFQMWRYEFERLTSTFGRMWVNGPRW